MTMGSLLKYFVFFLINVFAFCRGSTAAVNADSIPLPSGKQLAFQDAEIGVIFHYDLHVFDNKKYNQTNNRVTVVDDYNIFHPAHLNTDQWIKAAKAAGAKFAILTATHETGFALYQSDVNPYCMKALQWQNGEGDLVKSFVTSCRKYGIKPGIYLGIRWNSFFGVHNFKVEGQGAMRKNRQAYYNKMCEGMVKELCTRYGPLFMFWFDGGASDPALGAPDVLPVVKKYQPDCIFYHNAQLAEVRWAGSESGKTGYPCWSTFPFPSIDIVKYPEVAADQNFLLKHGDPKGNYYIPAFSDSPLRAYNGRHEWFWEPHDESHILPLENLIEIYYKSVGRNATLILGLTPDPSGLLPQEDVRRLKAFGDTIRSLFNKPIKETQGDALLINFHKEQQVNQIVIQEDISRGQRIKRYEVKGLLGDKWITICRGTSVGHKRIQVFQPVKLNKIKLVITDAVAQPLISSFKVYFNPLL